MVASDLNLQRLAYEVHKLLGPSEPFTLRQVLDRLLEATWIQLVHDDTGRALKFHIVAPHGAVYRYTQHLRCGPLRGIVSTQIRS